MNAVLILPENFLNFRSDWMVKQGIVNLNSYNNKEYASGILKDTGVTLLEEGEDAAFCPFLFCVLFIGSVA